jgi:predicted DNA binding protein
MSVIAHLRIPAESFELGRILDLPDDGSIELEDMVPLGEKAVPFFTVHETGNDAFEKAVRNHPSVKDLRTVSHHEGETLYALDWEVSRDLFFEGIFETDAHLLSARGSTDTWEFELRFPDHERLGDFQDFCSDAHISLEVGRIYNPTRPGNGPWYGLTPPQRETLVRAVRGGYYSIPRQMSTQDLATEFDISDQAVTERLRRAIVTLVENTIIAAMEDETFEPVE